MDARTILGDLNAAIELRWNEISECPHTDEIHLLSDQIKTVKSEIKSIKLEKQELSGCFRKPDLSSEAKSELKKKMQAVSAQLKSVEEQRKSLEARLLELFAEQKTKPEIPRRFSLPSYDTSSKAVNVTIERATSAEQWNDYIESHPLSSAYHRYEWRDIINHSFGHETINLAAIDEAGELRGVLPLTLLNSRIFGHFLVSMPYFNYGGPLADTIEIEKSLLEAAAALCKERNAEHLEIRATRKLNDWPDQKNKVSMILSLPESQKALDKQLGAKLRAQINQAIGHELTVKSGGIELLDDYYDVFAENMRDLGTPVYSKQFFANILNSFSSECTLIVLFKGNKAISTAFLIGHKDMLEIPWASTLRRYNPLNANMLLYRHILGFAIDSGYGYFDFGRSSKDANTFRFKKQWGAKPVQHYWHYWLAEGQALPGLNPSNPKYQLAIAVWQKLPVWLTKIIGPPIVKNLP